MSRDPEPLWTTTDIAQRLGVSPAWARRLANSDDFPAPRFRHGLARFWTIDDVEAWIAEHRPDKAS